MFGPDRPDSRLMVFHASALKYALGILIEQELANGFVVGFAALDLLGNDVGVLETALNRSRCEDGIRTAQVVDDVHGLCRLADRMGTRHAQAYALSDRDLAGFAHPLPYVSGTLIQQRPGCGPGRFSYANLLLHDAILGQRARAEARFLGEGEIDGRIDGGPRHPQGDAAEAAGEQYDVDRASFPVLADTMHQLAWRQPLENIHLPVSL